MNKLKLKYGTGAFDCSLPQAQIIQPERLPEPPDAGLVIRRALAAPIGSAGLAEIVHPGERVAIVTSDITRYTGSEIYLPILVEELNARGVPDRDIEIIVALGIHRKQTEAEHRKILGPLYGRIAVYDHDCDERPPTWSSWERPILESRYRSTAG